MRALYSMIFAALLLAGGCVSAEMQKEDPTGGVALVLDRDYVSAAGRGFHWDVVPEEADEDSLWNLQVVVNDTVVCGSDFGLPSDIFIGFWDKKSAEFYFEGQDIPVDAVPVKITFVFADGGIGQAVGFVYSEEGECIFTADKMLLTPEAPTAALIEFNADPRRISNADTLLDGGNIYLRENNLDYLPLNSIQLHLSKSLRPGQIPVAEIEEISQ